VVIIAVGIELGKIGLGVLFEEAAAHDVRTGRMFVAASCVLVTMTGLGVWGQRTSKASLWADWNSCRLRSFGVAGGVS
jgi:hypothetical protein